MKSSHYYKLLVFALSLFPAVTWAADFGDIPANLTLGAGTSVRRNSGNTLFEAFTAAPNDAHYVTTQAEGGLTNEFSLGSLSGGILKQTISGSIATLDIAIAGTDYLQNNQLITLSGEVSGSGATSITTTQTHFVTFDVDGVGIVLSTGTKNPFKTKYGGTLVGWTMMCNPSGSVTADIFRAANGAGLPVTSIVGAGTKPSISSNVENSSTSFTSWTSTTINANDNLAISLSGITTAQYVELTLWFK